MFILLNIYENYFTEVWIYYLINLFNILLFIQTAKIEFKLIYV